MKLCHRENTILKEQLKHYMGAVQMLKNSTSNAVITPTSLSVPPDYHQEANHFEEKLIQVYRHKHKRMCKAVNKELISYSWLFIYIFFLL